MGEELTPAAIDCILYNLSTWRRLVELMEPKTSASVVCLPVSGTRSSSAVERVAVRRALVTEVLDAAERGLKALPPELRQIARLRYDHLMTYREIARLLTRRARRRVGAERETTSVSTSTVYQKVESIRNICARYLRSVSKEFWGQIRTLELDGTEQRG